MVEWYAIEIDPHDILMCTELYKCLRDVLHCEGLADSCLYSITNGVDIEANLSKVYAQIVKNTVLGWRYTGLYAFISSLQDQAIVLTTNEFYSRFLHHTVTL